MLFIFLGLLYLALFVSAAPPLSISTTQVCATYYGRRSTMPIPSRTRTKKSTVTINRAVIVVPITTRTPKPVTKTSTSDVTISSTYTAPRETDTITTTTTLEATSTITSTITTPSTTTVTTTATIEYPGVTTTFSTSAGFVPIQSDVALPPERKRDLLARPSVEVVEAQGFGDEFADNDRYGSPGYDSNDRNSGRYRWNDNHDRWDHKRYPTSVMCEKFIKTLTTKFTTSTARKTTITRVAKTPTSWTTIMISHTSTVTEFPVHDRTTTTVSTTTTSVLPFITYEESTTTSTATSTSTLDPTATVFPGCAAENYRVKRQGHNIIGGDQVSNFDRFDFSYAETSREECCQKCQQRELCAGFYAGYGGGIGCVLALATSCAPNQIVASFFAPEYSDPNGLGYVIGNGNCGRLTWDGRVQ